MFEYLPYLTSMMLTMALIVYSLFLLYILSIEKKSPLNWVFAMVCLAMAIWSMAFAIAAGTETLLMARKWHRVAVFGYGTVYSFLLHAVIILTKNDRVFKHKVVYGLIYGPSLLNILFYSIKTPWFSYEYQLQQTPLGWITISNNTRMDWYFYVYLITFLVLTLSILLRWRLKTKDEKEIGQFRLIFSSVLIVTVIGVISDIILSDFLKMQSPQIGPLLVLIPLFATMYASAQYDMMATEKENEKTVSLKPEVKGLIYRYMAIGFAIGGVLAFISELFIEKAPVNSALAFGLIIASFGVVLSAILSTDISDVNKDNLVLLVTSMVVPFVIFNTMQHGSTTVWVIPFLFIIAFTLYNNGKMLTGVSVSSIISLVVAGTIMPEVTIIITRQVYSLRIMLVSIGIIFAALINRIYLNRLRENAEQLKGQQMIAEVSSAMVSTRYQNFDDRMNQVLECIGTHYKMDRSYFFYFSEDGTTMSNTYEWCTKGIEPEMESLVDIPVDLFPWWMNELKTNRVVIVPDVELMPGEAYVAKAELKRQQVKSTMAVSVFINEKQIGYIGVDAVKVKMAWRDEIVTNMRIIGNVMSDAFAKNNAEKVIHELAYFDQLTGLPSRQLFKDRLLQSLKMAKRSGHKVAVALLDLDAFKVINDTMGHDKGDQLLIDLGGRLESTVRSSDTVCRFGGDEFLLLCNNLKDDQDAIAIGEEVMASFKEVFVLDQNEFNVTASMGIALYPDDGDTADKLIKNADIAMYHAKDLGKNTFAMCNAHLKDRTMYTARITNALFSAIEKDELFMCYQPQIELSSGLITGVEALIRWRNKEIGLVEPTEFIYIAEHNGYILEIGEWVFREVFEQICVWEKEGYDDFTVAMNVSFTQMQNDQLVHLMMRLFNEYAIEPSRIELEITERICMNQKDDISEQLEKIRGMGIKIAIDHFGTEYSSLGRIKNLTVDKIKIARPFIDGITKSNKDEAIVKSIIVLAKNLGVKTIAEGVESEEQLEFLSQQACDYVQGFLYHKPMLPEEITTLLKSKEC